MMNARLLAPQSGQRSQYGRVLILCGGLFAISAVALAQVDPGPRSGSSSAGGSLAGLDPLQVQLFLDGQSRFQEVDAVANGLGPRFNSNSCSSCHAQPAIGGSSPSINPQTAFANSSNTLPPFIQANGPVREVRFVSNPDGTPDGGVHALFTINGRPDNPSGCNLNQENFSNASNLALRIPTPTFGAGLIEAISDAALIASWTNTGSLRSNLGIRGRFNRNGNDGTITRFGWKAQNKSLQIFAGEAYNVEQGITNMLFMNERDDTPNCNSSASPNDAMNLGIAGTGEFDDMTAFAAFMAFLAPPARGPTSNSVVNGGNIFTNIGCAACHTATLQTGASKFAALSNQTIHPYSDFAIHHMGNGLADHVSQGLAGGDEFRTAPLWGLGQRLFFLHDGRTSDLVQAILAHAGPTNSPAPSTDPSRQTGPEASRVINNYNALNPGAKQDLLNFLRSL